MHNVSIFKMKQINLSELLEAVYTSKFVVLDVRVYSQITEVVVFTLFVIIPR